MAHATPLAHSLRLLLRHAAQPVAVVTTAINGVSRVSGHSGLHGATLSSFTSLSLSPLPLVAFALQTPSRTASSIQSYASWRRETEQPGPVLVINLLSASQANIAHKFARADLFPHPFSSIPHTIGHDKIPILDGCVGSIACSLLSTIPLNRATIAQQFKPPAFDTETYEDEGERTSELYLAMVEHVVLGNLGDDALPLLYHDRRYSTVHPVEKDSQGP